MWINKNNDTPETFGRYIFTTESEPSFGLSFRSGIAREDSVRFICRTCFQIFELLKGSSDKNKRT